MKRNATIFGIQKIIIFGTKERRKNMAQKEKNKALSESGELKQNFGLRKLSVGLASVLLSSTMWIGNSGHAHAATEKSDNMARKNDSQADATIKTDSGLMIQTADATDDRGQADDQKTAASVTVDSAKSDEASADDSASQQADAQASADSKEDVQNDAQEGQAAASAGTANGNAEDASFNVVASGKADAEERSTDAQDESAQKEADAKNQSSASTDNKSANTGDAKTENVNSGDTDTKSSVTLIKDNETGETSVSVAKDSASTTTLDINSLTESSLPIRSMISSLAATPAATGTNLSSDYYKLQELTDTVDRTVNYKTTDGSQAPESKKDTLTYKGETITGDLSSLIKRAENDGITVNKTEGKTYSTKEEALSDLSNQVNDIQKILSSYESIKGGYDIAMKNYENDLKKWQDAQSNPHTVKDISQALTFTSEKDANISISSPTGNPIDYIQSNKIRMKVGESILATYTNLKNSAYIDNNGTSHKISKVTIKYTLNQTPSKEGTAVVQLSNDPNDTFWFYATDNNSGIMDFTLEPEFYDAAGNKINFDKGGSAWLSLSSLNHQKNDAIEYFNPGNNDTRYIPGSTVVKHDDGRWYSDIINDNGAEDRGWWDTATSANRYYGAAIMELNSDTGFHVGKNLTYGDDGQNCDWFSLDTNLATAYKPIQPNAPAKPSISYHDVTATVWEGPKDFNDATTPEVKGYTPDRKVVSNKDIAHDHADIVETVTYTPEIQKLDVTYHDDTTNKDLKKDEISGNTSTVATKDGNPYTTKSSINSYKSQGYELVSDDTGGKQLTFDNDSSVDQHFVVHLKHGISTKQISDDVNRTINYTMSDGSKAPAQVKDSIHFNGTQTIDNLTKAVTNTTWDPNKDFKDVTSPAVKGYNPDRKVVSDKNIAHDHADIVENVVYKPDPQKAKVTYIDQTTGKTLKTDDLKGVSNAKSGYTTKTSIQDYEDNGYALVSDDTKGDEIVYDDDDAVDQSYTVVLKHTYQTITEGSGVVPGTPINKNPNGVKYGPGLDDASLGKAVKRDITYRMSDGTQAPGPVDSVLHFTAQKVIDKVTGEVLSTEWSPAQDYDDVVSPEVKGYTPDQKVISDKGITHEHSDIHEIVTYDPNPQKATVTYVDETTGKTITVKNLSGKSNGHSGYTTAEEIQALKNAGYVLVSDDTNGNEVAFDDDDSVDQAYVVKLKHRIDNSEEKHTATRTIRLHNLDGTIKQVGHVQRPVMTDAVTGKKTYGKWTTDNWDMFKTPQIDGYTSTLDEVAKKLVTGDTKDETVDIYYKKNPAPKAPEKPAETPKAPEAEPAPAPQLPQTGNSEDVAALAAGTFAAGASLLATVLKRRFQGKKQ